jgi:hypothetical protein
MAMAAKYYPKMLRPSKCERKTKQVLGIQSGAKKFVSNPKIGKEEKGKRARNQKGGNMKSQK